MGLKMGNKEGSEESRVRQGVGSALSGMREGQICLHGICDEISKVVSNYRV
jgi:hypothetical protein